MTEAEAAAQRALREIVARLESVRVQLLNIYASLPMPPEETATLAGEAAMDVATEVRSVIECILNDNLQPAIRDLQALTRYRLEEEEDDTQVS